MQGYKNKEIDHAHDNDVDDKWYGLAALLYYNKEAYIR